MNKKAIIKCIMILILICTLWITVKTLAGNTGKIIDNINDINNIAINDTVYVYDKIEDIVYDNSSNFTVTGNHITLNSKNVYCIQEGTRLYIYNTYDERIKTPRTVKDYIMINTTNNDEIKINTTTNDDILEKMAYILNYDINKETTQSYTSSSKNIDGFNNFSTSKAQIAVWNNWSSFVSKLSIDKKDIWEGSCSDEYNKGGNDDTVVNSYDLFKQVVEGINITIENKNEVKFSFKNEDINIEKIEDELKTLLNSIITDFEITSTAGTTLTKDDVINGIIAGKLSNVSSIELTYINEYKAEIFLLCHENGKQKVIITKPSYEDTTISAQASNSYSLTLEKLVENDNKEFIATEDIAFNITATENVKINETEITKDTQTSVTTNNEGKINFTDIPKDTMITIQETTELIGISRIPTLYIKVTSSGIKEYVLNEANEYKEGSQGCLEITEGSALVKIKNFKKATTDLTIKKIDAATNKVLEGVKFSISTIIPADSYYDYFNTNDVPENLTSLPIVIIDKNSNNYDEIHAVELSNGDVKIEYSGVCTNESGEITITELLLGSNIEIKEVKADGYILIEKPINITINKVNEFTELTDSGFVTIDNNEKIITIKNTPKGLYTLDLLKIDHNGKKLNDIKFSVNAITNLKNYNGGVALYGDINKDGVISETDYTKLTYYFTYQNNIEYLKDIYGNTKDALVLADVDGNGTIEEYDKTLINNYFTENGDTGNVGKPAQKEILNKDYVTKDGEFVSDNNNVTIPIDSIGATHIVTITEKKADGYDLLEEPIVLVVKTKLKDDKTGLEVESINFQDGTNYKVDNNGTLKNGTEKVASIDRNTMQIEIINMDKVKISGKVWLDGEEGKASELNGKSGDKTDRWMKGIQISAINTKNIEKTYDTTTNEYGRYELAVPKGEYIICFEYNGMVYTEVKNVVKDSVQSKASEIKRDSFNNRFTTIKADGEGTSISNDGIKQEYIINEDHNPVESYVKTTYETTEDKENYINVSQPLEEYIIGAQINEKVDVTEDLEDLDLGLVKRTQADLAVNAAIDNVELTVNGQNGIYEGSARKSDFKDGTEQINMYYSDYKTTKDDITGNELSLNITYLVQIQNKEISTVASRVNSLNIEYDTKLSEIIGVKTKSGEGLSYSVNNNIMSLKANEDNKDIVAKTEYMENELSEFYITFKVDVSKFGADIAKAILELKPLVAEITSYSTEEGLIDKDSIPGNNPTYNEDDTGISKKLEIWTSKEYQRKITGYVWEDIKTKSNGIDDSNGDGILNDGENKINGVTVQLVDKDGNLVEDSMRNGIVAKTTIVENENGEEIDSGYYQLSDFLPGDYRIKFIYGTELESKDNGKKKIIKYNGQDYKSTIDKTKNLYNKVDSVGLFDLTDNMSYAFDNEARRLEVNMNSNIINKDKGEELYNLSEGVELDNLSEENANINTLINNTSMYAITPIINCPLGASTNENNQKIVAYAHGTDGTNKVLINKISSYEKSGINFGLVQRPTTDLELEKEIEKVTIKIVGTNEVLTFTKEDVEANRVILDELLMYGSELKVQYKYIITDKSQEDYYNSVNTSKLATFYYTGEKGEEDKLVTSKATIYDYVDASNTEYLYNGRLSYTGELEKDENNKIITKTISGVKGLTGVAENITKNISYNIIKIADNIEISKNNEAQTIFTSAFSTIIPSKAQENWESGLFNGYVAEIVSYSNQAGRRDVDSIPGNGKIIKEVGNLEDDESAAKSTLSLLPPTGDNKNYTTYYILGAVIAIMIAGGVILIKKLVVKK